MTLPLPVCPICGIPGRVCGDDHITLPVISSALIKGEPMTNPNPQETETPPQELQEYEYYVGHTKMTAMLTKEMAERMDAKPVGTGTDEDAPKPGEVPNRTAEQTASQNAEADKNGVDGPDAESVNKARTTRNRRAQ